MEAPKEPPAFSLARLLSVLFSLGGVALFSLELSSYVKNSHPHDLTALPQHPQHPYAAGGAGQAPASTSSSSAASSAAYVCRPNEVFAQAHEFLRLPRETATGCPPREVLWPTLVTKGLSCRALTIVNVGANKGYLLASLLDLLRPALGITPASLHAHLVTPAVAARQNLHDGCGFCNDCLEGHLPTAASGARTCFSDAGELLPPEAFPLTLHAFEATLSNAELLDYGVLAMARESRNATALSTTLHRQAVVGDPAVTVVQFGNCKAGVERCGVADAEKGFLGATKSDNDIGTVSVPAVTLDAWAETEGVTLIDLLAVDTEGMDPEVLKGASRLLESRRVRIVEFEYHSHRAWQATSLQAVVERLDGYGFDCFFENLSTLTRLTGCWHGSYEIRGWSNVICALRSEVAVVNFFHSLTVNVNK
jgi:FkbM family methyltransferase